MDCHLLCNKFFLLTSFNNCATACFLFVYHLVCSQQCLQAFCGCQTISRWPPLPFTPPPLPCMVNRRFSYSTKELGSTVIHTLLLAKFDRLVLELLSLMSIFESLTKCSKVSFNCDSFPFQYRERGKVF